MVSQAISLSLAALSHWTAVPVHAQYTEMMSYLADARRFFNLYSFMHISLIANCHLCLCMPYMPVCQDMLIITFVISACSAQQLGYEPVQWPGKGGLESFIEFLYLPDLLLSYCQLSFSGF
jgi:hypothetical protein